MTQVSEGRTGQWEIGGLGAGDHLCSIYRCVSEQMRVIVPFLNQGLKNNDKCVYIIEESTREDSLRALGEAGFDPTVQWSSGQFVFLTLDESLPDNGGLDPDQMIDALKQMELKAIQEGYAGLRVTVEVTGVFLPVHGVGSLIELESKLNSFLSKRRSSVICQYQEARFEPGILIDVLRCHSKVAIYGDLCVNPYCLGPQALGLHQSRSAIPLALYHGIRDGILARSELEGERRRIETEFHASLAQSERVRRALLGALEDARLKGEELRKSEERFRSLFEQAADCILIFEIAADGVPVIQDANMAAIGLLGYTREELTGKPYTILEPRPDLVTASEERRRLVNTGSGCVIEVTHRCKDGTRKDFECSVREMKIGSKVFAISMERDVSRSATAS